MIFVNGIESAEGRVLFLPALSNSKYANPAITKVTKLNIRTHEPIILLVTFDVLVGKSGCDVSELLPSAHFGQVNNPG